MPVQSMAIYLRRNFKPAHLQLCLFLKIREDGNSLDNKISEVWFLLHGDRMIIGLPYLKKFELPLTAFTIRKVSTIRRFIV